MSVGALVPEKNPLGTIRAIGAVLLEEEFSEYQYVWCGDGPMASDSRELISHLQLEDRITLLGHVPEHELRELYKTAEVLVQYSASDTLPYAVLDAMKYGLTFLGSDSGGIPFLAGSTKDSCVFSLSDENAMSAGLRKILRDSKLRAVLSEQQAQIFEREFSFRKWTNSMERLLTTF